MNNVNLVGRLTIDPEMKEISDGSYKTVISLAIPRDYKNSDNVVEADFVKVIFWNNKANITKNYCHKGDLVAVKGKIQSRCYQEDNVKKYLTEIIGDKITFICKFHPKEV